LRLNKPDLKRPVGWLAKSANITLQIIPNFT